MNISHSIMFRKPSTPCIVLLVAWIIPVHFALAALPEAETRVDTKAAPGTEPAAPPAPKEFAFVLSPGYGEGDRYSKDDKIYENLLVNMKKSGFNTIHSTYTPERLALCKKHGVKMMIDVLAWKEGAEADIRRPEQRDKVKAYCIKLRDHDAVWGYNLWNETLSFFGNPDGKDIDTYVAMLREWDPTHPVWMGTRTVSYANAPKSRPGIHGYYDYPWQRGFQWHFADLKWYFKYVPTQDGYIGRWEQGSNYNWNSYSLNTSICFGTKVTIWFIGGPFNEKGDIDTKHRFHHLIKIGQETQTLYPEIGKIGRPSAVFSTPTTLTHDNKKRDPEKDKGDTPWQLAAFPKDHWLQAKSGEWLAGFFNYPNIPKDKKSPDADAVYIANHNAYQKQDVGFELDGKAFGKNVQVELFDREKGQWAELSPKQGVYTFPLRAAGGELVRIRGRVVNNP